MSDSRLRRTATEREVLPFGARVRAWLDGLRRGSWLPLSVAAMLTAMMMAFGGAKGLDRAATLFLANTLVAFGIAASVTFGFAVVVPTFGLARRSFVRRFALEGATTAAFTAVGSEVAVRIAESLVPEAGFSRRGVLQVALPVSAVVTALSLAFDRLRERSEEAEQRTESTERELLRAELEALRTRVQPHFLFNALNTVASLIEEDPVAAERALLELAALFRYTLEGSRKTLVPLGEELTAARRYLAFEQLRFGDRLRTAVDAPEAASGFLVPPLLLQPLVENAVVHGIGDRKEGGRVRITARVEEGLLTLSVEDDGPGPEGSDHVGSRTATADLERRLALAYGRRARLEVSRGALGGYLARLVLPATDPDVAEAREARHDLAGRASA